MPDTSLTLANLREHFRKHLALYAAMVVAALILSDLLWTVTTPRIPTDQSVVIFLADDVFDPEPLSAIADDVLARTRAFDGSLRAVSFEGLQVKGGEDDYTGAVLLLTRLSVHEGDAFLAGAGAMAALVSAGGALPLDDYLEAGWLAGYPLAPYRATLVDGETGEPVTRTVGLRLDGIDALAKLGALDNEGACLAIAANSDNLETAMRAVEFMLEDLTSSAGEAGA